MTGHAVRAAKIQKAVASYGKLVKPKLTGGGAEEQLKTPTELFFIEVGKGCGLEPVVCHGETLLVNRGIRPDIRVDVGAGLVGYVELKAPEVSIDPATFHQQNRVQYEKLMLLPNVLYSNGRCWRLYRSGRLEREAALNSDVRIAGSTLAPAGPEFADLVWDFLSWSPTPPRDINGLVKAIAKLCRLLRSEVAEAMSTESGGDETRLDYFTRLAANWRALLFPEASDEVFADQYAQTVTFALLLSRVEGISFEGRTVKEIADKLEKRNSLMGTALAVLANETVLEIGLSVAVDTLTSVIGQVDWSLLDDGTGDAYLHLYERFLTEYDPDLRRDTGSYYTPSQVVEPMVALVDQILKTRLGHPRGYAEPAVTVLDPAMGTGTFLLSIIESTARSMRDAEGDGSVPPALRDLLQGRLAGFELQMGPFAVAQLRIFEALHRHRAEVADDKLQLRVTDTLDDPQAIIQQMGLLYEPIADSRKEANRLKATVPVQVVIGNPPYGERPYSENNWICAEGRIGARKTKAPLIDAFRIPGNGAKEYKLANHYIDFWRFATWKAFDAHEENPAGVIAFITLSGYCTGQAFRGMRKYLREAADEGWIINLTPEGQQPPVPTRVFRDVQQPLCIGIFVRSGNPDPTNPAVIRHLALSGSREEKFQALAGLGLDDAAWQTVSTHWEETFLPVASQDWASYPLFNDLMPWAEPGLKANRAWVIAPSAAVLKSRWDRLITAPTASKDKLMKATDARSSITLFGLGRNKRGVTIGDEKGPCPPPKQIAYRSFDRQWLIDDRRLIDRMRDDLRSVEGDRQVFTTELHTGLLTDGPGLTFTALLPDNDHYKGNSGGRAIPLYRDVHGLEPNITPGLLALLSKRLGYPVTAEDFLAYVAAVVAHGGYTQQFRDDLVTPGVRVPVSADPATWNQAIKLGRRILWLHTYGERYAGPVDGRPKSSGHSCAVQMPADRRPKHIVTIPDQPHAMPARLRYDAADQTLHVGAGTIAPVPEAVVNYTVSGMKVLAHWFGYRKANPAGKRSTPLDDITADRWTPENTTELLSLLNVLGSLVDLEPQQAELLQQIIDGPLVSVADLEGAGILPAPAHVRKPPGDDQDQLF